MAVGDHRAVPLHRQRDRHRRVPLADPPGQRQVDALLLAGCGPGSRRTGRRRTTRPARSAGPAGWPRSRGWRSRPGTSPCPRPGSRCRPTAARPARSARCPGRRCPASRRRNRVPWPASHGPQHATAGAAHRQRELATSAIHVTCCSSTDATSSGRAVAVRLAILGGGGFRVPLIYRALRPPAGARHRRGRAARRRPDRLRVIAAVLAAAGERRARGSGWNSR